MMQKAVVRVVLLAAALVVVGRSLAADAAAPGGHTTVIERPVLVPDEGLLLGNGDLSVSVYQAADKIIFRFGKGDVWDRRLDLSEDPKPAHINEIAHGIEVEGWKCGPYGGPVEATKGTSNPKRMKEICQGCPPNYQGVFPYPCPKPVGELALHLPPDQRGLSVRQSLAIEEARLQIDCTWSSGLKLHVDAFIPPKPNVLVVQWKAENWNAQTRLDWNAGEWVPRKPVVWFSLYRWSDPTLRAFETAFFANCRHSLQPLPASAKATPLPPPSTKRAGPLWSIEQTFPAEPTFPNGFSYWMAPLLPAKTLEPVVDPIFAAVKERPPGPEARLHMLPEADATEGQVAIAVTTTRDPGGPAKELERIQAELGSKPAATLVRWAEENRRAAAEFWSRSKLSIADPLLENLWYETYHARRCAYRRGTIPPGLLLPSTVRDYSEWHGDYHLNYNFQQPFYGDYTANHLDLGDAYFDGMAFALPIGRKIARDYYGCRGAFLQLTVYPIDAHDDPLGTVPMGRMAYITGWGMSRYWWRYLVTLDREWLRTTGYPAMRDCALFYADFMKKRADGLYHIFPSNQGEDGFTGDAKDYTDRAQVMQHMRYCLRTTIRASEVLGVDEELRALWRDRLEHAAGDDGKPPLVLTGLEKECHEANPAEFGFGHPYRPQPDQPYTGTQPGPWWASAQLPIAMLARLRTGEFLTARDLPAFRREIERWRQPNGVLCAYPVAYYNHAGIWGEALGIAAPLQEMMLQSWDGALRIFPAWPKGTDARFENFRAEGAFLVTAAWSKGQVTSLAIRSEKGGACRVYSPWTSGIRVTDSSGAEVAVTADTYSRPEFATQPGMVYHLQAR
jgi:hypothetical protein